MNSNSVYLKRSFNCSAASLFQWLVQPERIAMWFGPEHLQVISVESDLKVGGKFQIALKKAPGTSFSIRGEYLQVDEPKALVFSYRYYGLSSPPPDSVVSMQLEDQDHDRCQLSFSQSFEGPSGDMASRTQAWEHMFGVLAEKSAHS